MQLLRKGLHLLWIVAFLMILTFSADADDAAVLNDADAIDSGIYSEGRISLQIISGGLFSPLAIAEQTPVLNYVQFNVRVGWMINDPSESKSLLRGNFETMFELSNSIISKGFGDYIGGFTGLMRYNFVQPDSNLIPYIQAGAGIVYTDAYRDHSQDAIGQAIEFTLQGSLGLHYLIKKNWSIDAEAVFHHISNAGMSDRNIGINATGGFIGITCFFERLLPKQAVFRNN